MDVKTTFLNGDGDHRVCKLQQSIYGLKQTSRSWNHHFDETIKSFDCIKNEEESCVYKRVSESAITFLKLYMDDILLIGNDIPMRPRSKNGCLRNSP